MSGKGSGAPSRGRGGAWTSEGAKPKSVCNLELFWFSLLCAIKYFTVKCLLLMNDKLDTLLTFN